jgi:hypothetical protein
MRSVSRPGDRDVGVGPEPSHSVVECRIGIRRYYIVIVTRGGLRRHVKVVRAVLKDSYLGARMKS